MFSNWVTAGGNLIAMRPDKKLASLLGLTDASATLADALPAGQHRFRARHRHRQPDDAVPRHGGSLHALAARPRSRRSIPTRDHRDHAIRRSRSAASERRRAGGGLHLRPGALGRLHPPGQSGLVGPGARRHRRRSAPTTCSSAAPSRTTSTSTKVAIPQADEQQRLLANLITVHERRSQAAAEVLVSAARPEGGGGDDRRRSRATTAPPAASTSTTANSPLGCSVADWECVRGDVLHLPEHADHASRRPHAYAAQGFEIGVHVTTGCADYTPTSLENNYDERPGRSSRAIVPGPAGAAHQPHPLHRLERLRRPSRRWRSRTASGSTPTTTTGPAPGCNDVPGLFTGSGMPMRFAKTRRHADRRLPGGDPDDRRVGSDLPAARRHAARPGARPRGLLRRRSPPTCTPTPRRTRARRPS